MTIDGIQRKACLQLPHRFIDEGDDVRARVRCRSEHRGQPYPDHRSRQRPHAGVIRGSPGPLGNRLREQPHGPGELVEQGRAKRWGRQQEPDALTHVRLLRWRQPRQHVAECGSQRPDRARLDRLRPEDLDDERVELVPQNDVLLGGKVAEERAVRDLRRLGDLAYGGRVVPLLAEQPQRVPLDRSTRPGLLAFAEPERRGLVPQHHAIPPPILGRVGHRRGHSRRRRSALPCAIRTLSAGLTGSWSRNARASAIDA